MPFNEVNFKIFMEAKHEGGHYFKLKYSWFSPQAVPTSAATERDKQQMFNIDTLETAFMKDWNLVQVEGEPANTATPDEEKKEVAPAKGAAKKPPAKDPKKPAAALEEITDNRPRIVNLTKNFADESVASTKVNDDFAHFFEKFGFKFQIWKVDRET